jgi:protein-S-isoprenylcysteine O-methyltransferase Ste14
MDETPLTNNLGGLMGKIPLIIYVAAMLASRLTFRHRERSLARTSDGSAGQPAGGMGEGILFFLLPLGLMQLSPCVEFVLRYKQLIPGYSQRWPPTLGPGLAVFALGTALAAVAARQLARGWEESPGELVTTGLYSFIRHPMYAGYIVQGAGCMLMLGVVWSWALYGLAVLLVFWRVVREDRELSAAWPAEFTLWSAKVKRFIPRIL